jgi:hypothetical protein
MIGDHEAKATAKPGRGALKAVVGENRGGSERHRLRFAEDCFRLALSRDVSHDRAKGAS